jgi:organic radical activating enzyme
LLINLFNSEVNLRENYCSRDNDVPLRVEQPYINLYVRFSGCNANCSFCEFKTCNKFNFQKFQSYVTELASKIELRKISFTGGEPGLHFETLKEAVKLCKTVSPDSFYVLNTNSTNIEKTATLGLDSISVSRHHFNQQLNDEVFNIETASLKTLEQLNDNNLIHLSCNLIKGYIDSPEKIEEYVNEAAKHGLCDLGFVSLMKVNSWTTDKHIAFNDKIENFFKVIEWKDGDSCFCNNYLYTSKNNLTKPVSIYNRNVLKPNCFENMLTFDGENIRIGYTGKILTEKEGD